MKQNQKIITAVAALLAVIGIVVMAFVIGNNPDRNNPNDTNPDIVTCPIKEVNDATTVTYDGVAGETALATLQGLCKVDLHPTYDGFVTGIDGREADDAHFWAFYINNEFATEGAGDYKAKEGDEIKWVLTEIDLDLF